MRLKQALANKQREKDEEALKYENALADKNNQIKGKMQYSLFYRAQFHQSLVFTEDKRVRVDYQSELEYCWIVSSHLELVITSWLAEKETLERIGNSFRLYFSLRRESLQSQQDFSRAFEIT